MHSNNFQETSTTSAIEHNTPESDDACALELLEKHEYASLTRFVTEHRAISSQTLSAIVATLLREHKFRPALAVTAAAHFTNGIRAIIRSCLAEDTGSQEVALAAALMDPALPESVDVLQRSHYSIENERRRHHVEKVYQRAIYSYSVSGNK